tara:strand:+ start:311 stop:502 length:192 start_codon:yes stop_codon:yes gene_type:complete
MSSWAPHYGEPDKDGGLPYGKFKVCTTCAAPLGDPLDDEEMLAHHGYCSRECASEGYYGNYTM